MGKKQNLKDYLRQQRLINFLHQYWADFRPNSPSIKRQDKELLKSLKILKSSYPFPILEIETAKMLDHLGIPYKSEQHYHNKALGDSRGIHSSLKEHFDNFRPETLFCALYYYANGNPKINSIAEHLKELPPLFFCAGTAWSTKSQLERINSLINSGEKSCAHFGPNKDDMIKNESIRLKEASESITRNGYSPWRYPDGFIRGLIITDTKDYCFIVSAGKHRAATVAKNNEKALVRLHFEDCIPIVNLNEAASLPLVKEGAWNTKAAQLLIEYFIGICK